MTETELMPCPIMTVLNAVKTELRSHQWQKVPKNDWATGRQDGLEKAIEVVDDALIKQATILSRRPIQGSAGEGWQPIDSAPKDGTTAEFERRHCAALKAAREIDLSAKYAARALTQSEERALLVARAYLDLRAVPSQEGASDTEEQDNAQVEEMARALEAMIELYRMDFDTDMEPVAVANARAALSSHRANTEEKAKASPLGD